MTEGKTETEVGESYIGLCIRESRKNRNKSTCIGGQLRVQHCAGMSGSSSPVSSCASVMARCSRLLMSSDCCERGFIKIEEIISRLHYLSP